MITLKNGLVVPYNKDFDVFFRSLLETIVVESRKSASATGPVAGLSENEKFLKEVMDNCIFVTHQLFEIAKEREEFSRFIVTGFIFNGIVYSLPLLELERGVTDPEEGGQVH